MSTAFTIARRLPAADQKLRELVVGGSAKVAEPKAKTKLQQRIARMEGEVAQLKRLLALQSQAQRLRLRVAQGDARGGVMITIVGLVSERMQCSAQEIVKRGNQPSVAWPRHVVCYLARAVAGLSTPKIALALGGRSHAAVLNSDRQVRARMDTEPKFNLLVQALEGECRKKIEGGAEA